MSIENVHISQFVVLCVGLLAAAIGSQVYADPALVLTEQGCGIPTPDGGFVFNTEAQIISTQSVEGTRTLNCKFDGVPNPEGQAIRANGHQLNLVGCMIAIDPTGPFCVTADWNFLISASGQASLNCKCTNQDNL